MNVTNIVTSRMLQGLATSYIGSSTLLVSIRHPESKVGEPSDAFIAFNDQAEQALKVFAVVRDGESAVLTPSLVHDLVTATPLQLHEWSKKIDAASQSELLPLNQLTYSAAKRLATVLRDEKDAFLFGMTNEVFRELFHPTSSYPDLALAAASMILLPNNWVKDAISLGAIHLANLSDVDPSTP